MVPSIGCIPTKGPASPNTVPRSGRRRPIPSRQAARPRRGANGLDNQWTELDGTSTARGLIEGSANVEEHTFFREAGISYGIAIRAYDAKTAQWAIWRIDGRAPHAAMDPPVQGHFTDGVGTFYSDAVIDGKTMRTRYIWSQITAQSARWEQALSDDLGKTWDTNWVMEFRRVE